MSTQNPFGRQNAAFPTLPKGDVLGTYQTYPEAQRVVAKLAASDFPVARLSIVGNDLKTVERVIGRMTYGRAAVAGALSGLWLGIFFAIVLTLFSSSGSSLIPAAAIIGVGFGMLYGIVSFAITKRQRDFTSVHQVLASSYQIIVDPALTARAQRLLGQSGAVPSSDWGGRGGNGPGAGPSSSGTSPYGGQGTPYGGQATPYGERQQPRPEAQPPRYGTNDGPRYGETAPSDGVPRADLPSAEEPPRYGERVDPQRQPSADGHDDGQGSRASGDGEGPGAR